MKVTICCITKNEDIHLERLINNIRDISENIIIVDSFSEDQTQKIAHKYNCFFYQRIFDNFSNQKNFCLSKVQDGNKWVLFLDADEFISDELKNEIKSLNSLSTTYDAYKFKRKFFWKNTWIKRGYYPLWFLRLGRKKYIKFDDNKINEHMLCSTNKIGILKGYFIDYNLKNTKSWFAKHNLYANMEANRFFLKNENAPKRILWNKLPLVIRPFMLIFYRLFIKLSVLDGAKAVQYHFYHDLIYRLMIDIKIIKKKLIKK